MTGFPSTAAKLAQAALIVGLTVAMATIFAPPGHGHGEAEHGEVPGGAQTDSIVKDGVSIEFTIAPAGGDATAAALAMPVQAGDDALVTLRFTDAGSGAPLSGVGPAVWLDARKKGQADLTCRDKIESFLQGQISYRPEIDLNAWYIMTLNDRPSLTVIDPLLGFGGQQTVALVLLDGPGEDWAMSADQKLVYVTLPDRRRVSVVDTGIWKVVANIDLPVAPVAAELQPDGRYLWVDYPDDGAGDPGGVLAIDTATRTVAFRLSTGAGPHRMAIGDDDRYMAVASAGAGAVTLVDIAGLKSAGKLETGGRPVAVAWSTLAGAFYAADAETGEILVIDPAAAEPLRTRIATAPGLADIAFASGGRWAFAANRAENRVEILDATVNRVAQSVATEAEPYRTAFTDEFAYIRAAGSDHIGIVALAPLAKGEAVNVQNIPAGQTKPGDAGLPETAAPVVPTPDGDGVLIANPLDRSIYYYTEGMAAPSGSFANERALPRGVMAISRALREDAPGEYSGPVRLPEAGDYDVAVLLDSPRLWHCFTATALAAPGGAVGENVPVGLDFLVNETGLTTGEEATIRFRLRDGDSGAARTDIDDLRVLTFLVPGTWQRRVAPTRGEDGVWEVSFTPPQSGLYYLFVASAELGAGFRDLPFLSLRATDAKVSP